MRISPWFLVFLHVCRRFRAQQRDLSKPSVMLSAHMKILENVSCFFCFQSFQKQVKWAPRATVEPPACMKNSKNKTEGLWRMLPNEAFTEVMHTCVQRGVLLARLLIHVPRLDQMLNLNRRSFRVKTLLPATTGPGPENHSSQDWVQMNRSQLREKCPSVLRIENKC